MKSLSKQKIGALTALLVLLAMLLVFHITIGRNAQPVTTVKKELLHLEHVNLVHLDLIQVPALLVPQHTPSALPVVVLILVINVQEDTTALPRLLLFLNCVLLVHTAKKALLTSVNAHLASTVPQVLQFQLNVLKDSTVLGAPTSMLSVPLELTVLQHHQDLQIVPMVCTAQALVKTGVLKKDVRNVVAVSTLRMIPQAALTACPVLFALVQLAQKDHKASKNQTVILALRVTIVLLVVTRKLLAQLEPTLKNYHQHLVLSACHVKLIGITIYSDKVVARNVDLHLMPMVVP